MIRIATACLCLYWLALFVGTHLPSSSLPVLRWSDKLLHAVAFSGLSFLLAWAIPSGKRLRHLLIVISIAVSYACIDELTQKLIPGRTCDIWDVAADCVGIAIGVLAYTCCRQILLATQFGRNLIQSIS